MNLRYPQGNYPEGRGWECHLVSIENSLEIYQNFKLKAAYAFSSPFQSVKKIENHVFEKVFAHLQAVIRNRSSESISPGSEGL